jgi:hypothetical protein
MNADVLDVSDPFLGYTRCGGHDYLVGQLAECWNRTFRSARTGRCFAS